jgi:hypothetical protein
VQQERWPDGHIAGTGPVNEEAVIGPVKKPAEESERTLVNLTVNKKSSNGTYHLTLFPLERYLSLISLELIKVQQISGQTAAKTLSLVAVSRYVLPVAIC